MSDPSKRALALWHELENQEPGHEVHRLLRGVEQYRAVEPEGGRDGG